jgi:signal transduction histidine kinase
MTLEQIPVSMRELVHEAVNLFSGRASEKGLVLQAQIDPNAPDWVLGDPVRLRQIVANFISNAIKFTHEGSVTVILLPSPTYPQGVWVGVQDTGIGIPEDKQSIAVRGVHPGGHLHHAQVRRHGAGAGNQ